MRRLIQTCMVVAQVCQAEADASIYNGSSLAQVGQPSRVAPSAIEPMTSALEVMSIMEIVMVICGLVYLVQQIAKAAGMLIKRCTRKKEVEMVYVHYGRSVYHKKTFMWYCPPPKTRPPSIEDAHQQGFRSCWRCHPEDKPKKRAPELALTTASNYEEIRGKLCVWCGDGVCSRRKESHMNCACTECIRDYAEAMWRAWYDVDEMADAQEATYDQTQPDDIDDTTWERMTLAERRMALEAQGRELLGQSERQAYYEYVQESQRRADEVQVNQEPEGGARRRNRGRNMEREERGGNAERDYESYVDPGTPDSTEERTQGPRGYLY